MEPVGKSTGAGVAAVSGDSSAFKRTNLASGAKAEILLSLYTDDGDGAVDPTSTNTEIGDW